MSNKLKIKLTFTISLFLIIAVLVYGAYILLYNNKKIDNVSYNNNNIQILGDSTIKKDNVITVVLNSGNKEDLEVIENDGQVNIIEDKISIPAYARPSNDEEVQDIYYIKVNYLENVVTVYTKDINGNYTIPYKAFTCSTGTATPTSGTYKTDYKYRWLGLFGNVYGQYCTRIVGNILFHSVPYLEKGNEGSLEYWEYDKLRNISICWLYKTYSIRCKMDI